MKIIKQLFVFIGVSVGFASLFLSSLASADEAALASFIKKLEQMDSMQANFVQSTRDKRNNILQELKGTLLVAKPGKMRWQTEAPYAQLVVSDNQSVWMYDEDLEQVTIRDMEQRVQETPALLLSGNNKEISENFAVSFTENGSFSRYSLKPKDASQLFERIEFQYFEKTLESMRIYDATGQITEIVFSDIENNPKTTPAQFIFKAPKGTDVIDARSGK